ncbi:Serine-threonine protein kinase [Entamoeba marina]
MSFFPNRHTLQTQSKSVPKIIQKSSPKLKQCSFPVQPFSSSASASFCLFPLVGEDQLRFRNCSLDGIPLFVEHAFKFLEVSAVEAKDVVEPLQFISHDEALLWVGTNFSNTFIEYVRNKKMDGHALKQLKLQDLRSQKFGIFESETIIKTIKERVKETNFGKRILRRKEDSDAELRLMFKFIDHHNNGRLIPFNTMNKKQAHVVAFMIIRNFLCSFNEIVSDKSYHKIYNYSLFHYQTEDEQQFAFEFDNLLKENITPLQYSVLLRTLKFMDIVMTSRGSVFAHFLKLFEKTMFSLLSPYSYDSDFSFLLSFHRIRSSRNQWNLYNTALFDTKWELLFGEYIIMKCVDVSISSKTFPIKKSLLDVSSKDWALGILYLTNYRLWWIPYDKDIYRTQPFLLSRSYIPLKCIRYIKSYDVKEDTTKEKRYCFRAMDYFFRLFIFGFSSAQIMQDVKEQLSVQSGIESYPTEDMECISFEEPLKGFIQRKIIRLNLEESEDYHKVADDNLYKNEYIVHTSIKSFGANGLEANIRIPILIHKSLAGGCLSRLYISKESQQGRTYFLSSPEVVQSLYKPAYLSQQAKGDMCLLKTRVDVNAMWDYCIENVINFTEQTDFNDIVKVFDEYLKYIENVIKSCFSIADKINIGESLMLQPQGDNESESPLYSAFIQFILDNYYLTYNGFIELIFTEFIQTGYFAFCEDSNVIPQAFIIFLKMVEVVVSMFPNTVEFGTDLIIYLELVCKSGKYRFEDQNNQKSVIELLSLKSKFRNSDYNSKCVIDLLSKSSDICFSVRLLYHSLFRWLSHGEDGSFPIDITQTTLSLSNKNLVKLPLYSNLNRCTLLTKLDISNNNLIIIPNQISKMTWLQNLDISSCQLYSIPTVFFEKMISLTSLNLTQKITSSQRINEYPIFSSLTNLQKLEICNYTHLANSSMSMQIPHSLKTFIACGSLSFLPATSNYLTLEKIDFSKNTQFSWSSLTTISSLRTVILKECDKTSITTCLFTLRLKKLDVSRNKIERLPPTFYNCVSLEDINFSHNKIHTISSQLSLLKNLKSINTHKNPFTSKIQLNFGGIPSCVPLIIPRRLHMFCPDNFIHTFRKQLKGTKKNYYEIVKKPCSSSKKQLILNKLKLNIIQIPFDMISDDIYVVHQDIREYAHSIIHHILPYSQPYIFIGDKNNVQNQEIFISQTNPFDKLINAVNKQPCIDERIRRVAMEILHTHFTEFSMSKKKAIQNVKFFMNDATIKTLDQLHSLGVLYDLKKIEECKTSCSKKIPDVFPNARYMFRSSFFDGWKIINTKLPTFGSLHDIVESNNLLTFGDVLNICRILEAHNVLLLISRNWFYSMNLKKYKLPLLEQKIKQKQNPIDLRKQRRLNTNSCIDLKTEFITCKMMRKKRRFSFSENDFAQREINDNIFPIILKPSQDKLNQKAWPLHGKHEMEIMKCYVTNKPCYLLYLQLVAHLLLTGFELVENVYQDATILKTNQCLSTFLVKISHQTKGVSCSVRYKTSAVTYVLISADVMELVDNAIHNITKSIGLEIEEHIGCTECILKDEKNIETLPLKLLAEKRKSGMNDILFGRHEVKIGTCALGLVLADIRNSSDIKIKLKSEMDLREAKGFGASAKVFRTLVNDMGEVAFKMYSFNKCDKVTLGIGLGSTAHLVTLKIDELKNEMNVLETISNVDSNTNKYLLKLRAVCLEPLGLLIEYAPHGTLREYINDSSKLLPMSLVVRFASNINKAISVLHKSGIIHRDLKSPNVLISINENHKLFAVLSDFGLSGPYNEHEHYTPENPLWLAPEIFTTSRFVLQSDIYSFGIVVWEMIARDKPFGDCKFLSEIENRIKAGERPQFTSKMNTDLFLSELVKQCWDEDPLQRPTTSEIREVLFKVKSSCKE